MTGRIVDIKRFAVHDGPGIRTTVFMKGCSLACIWCHNPESIAGRPELAYYAHKCINCGSCVSACQAGAHSMVDGQHRFDRDRCVGNGACADVCLGNALVFYGREMTAAAVLEIVLEDKAFYDNSGGGLTVSGGEPLLQVTFVRELLELAKKASLHTAIDTCGAVSWNHFAAVLGLTDLFLYDIKHLDDAAHRRLTGSGNAQILDNLERLTASGQRVEIRIPLVPGCNDDPAHIDQIGRWLSRLPNITCVRILPYHAYARSKYAALGRPDTLPAVDSPTDEQLDAIAAHLKTYGLPAVSGRR